MFKSEDLTETIKELKKSISIQIDKMKENIQENKNMIDRIDVKVNKKLTEKIKNEENRSNFNR